MLKNLKEIEFFYHRFFYNTHVLTPRLETESLVREAIKLIKKNKIKVLIDIGTGSGIIPISIDLNTELDQILAIDKSKSALKIAEINKERLGSKVNFLEGDLLKPFFQDNFGKILGSVLITANLPYIKKDDWDNMSPDTRFEPKMALFGGKKSGFELYERFFRQISRLKKVHPEVEQVFILCEIGFDQTEVANEFLNRNGFNFSFVKDLREFERIIKIVL